MKSVAIACALAAVAATATSAAELVGPARYCGYSPIIDLAAGEKVTVLKGGIHAGTFLWEGAFGAMEVFGIGWASKPKGRVVTHGKGLTPTRFAQRKIGEGYEIAIWNRSHGAAYFKSSAPFTPQQIEAIGRVWLIDEGQTAEGCKLTTTFSWL